MLSRYILTDRFGYEWRVHETYQDRDVNAPGWLAIDCGDGRARSWSEVMTTRGFNDKPGQLYLQARFTEEETDRGAGIAARSIERLEAKHTTHNEETLLKVRRALQKSSPFAPEYAITNAITEMQNAGILFRERIAAETPPGGGLTDGQ